MGTPSPSQLGKHARAPRLALVVGAILTLLVFVAAVAYAVDRLSDSNDRLRARIADLEHGSKARALRIEELIEETEDLEGQYVQCRDVASIVERTQAGTETLLQSNNRIQVLRGLTRLVSLRRDLKRAVGSCLYQG